MAPQEIRAVVCECCGETFIGDEAITRCTAEIQAETPGDPRPMVLCIECLPPRYAASITRSMGHE